MKSLTIKHVLVSLLIVLAAVGFRQVVQAAPFPPPARGTMTGCGSVSCTVRLPLVTTWTRFGTLPPGSRLPSDAECARRVAHAPEIKRRNIPYNATPGNQRLASNFFDPVSNDPRANMQLAVRVTGHFTGTTEEILEWAACKWGIDEDIVRAQAAMESNWRQTQLGNWTSNSAFCAPGHGLGVDDPVNHPGECPAVWGILQTKYRYRQSAWPGMRDSTAFNTDTAYLGWRACFEGYEWWLDDADIEHVGQYVAGDVWGCIGRWYSGQWHTQAAEWYIGRVKDYLRQQVWKMDWFQEP